LAGAKARQPAVTKAAEPMLLIGRGWQRIELLFLSQDEVARRASGKFEMLKQTG
jgi:hypothetical protein